MIIVFHVELHGGRTEKLPVSCRESDALATVVASLRRKLSLDPKFKLDIRTKDGHPVKQGSTSVAALGLQHMNSLFAFVDEAGAVEQVELLQVPSTLLSSAEVPGDTASTSQHQHAGRGRVEHLGPAPASHGDDAPAEPDNSDDEYELSLALTTNAGLHSVKVNGVYSKSYARGSVANAGVVWIEQPVLAPLYPTQLVELVRSHERLHNRTYDPNFSTTSTIAGLDDSMYCRYLSIARTHGTLVEPTSAKGEKLMAFYPELTSIRHSCRPNSFIMMNRKRRPFRAVLRAAISGGISAGDEVTTMYHGTSMLPFLLLPADRRQMITQKLFHFTCRCPRCNKIPVVDETITGAFFADGIPAKDQKGLAAAMRVAFDKLHLVDQNSVPQPPARTGSAEELLDFVVCYGATDARLRLHKNHWRLSLARHALLAKVAASSKPERFLNREFFGVALDQLSCESLFVPPGHPFSVINFRKFNAFQRLLPDALAAAVQKRAVSCSAVDWETLQATSALWK